MNGGNNVECVLNEFFLSLELFLDYRSTIIASLRVQIDDVVVR